MLQDDVIERVTMRAQASLDTFEAGKDRAKAWFEELRDRMLAALEAIEDTAEGAPGCEGKAPGRFTRSPWDRPEGGGAQDRGDDRREARMVRRGCGVMGTRRHITLMGES